MACLTLIVTFFTFLFCSVAAGQKTTAADQMPSCITATADGEAPCDQTPTTQPKGLFSPFPVPDYSGDLAQRRALGGDWGGVRNELAEQGIRFDMDILQILQGNPYGGKNQENGLRYSGSSDYVLTFDTGRMGLWPAGRLTVRGETQFGQSLNPKVGSIIPVNYDARVPREDECGLTTLSEVFLTQIFSKKFYMVVGKLDLKRFADQNEFAHDETTQFINAGFRSNPGFSPHAPYTTLTLGTKYCPTDWMEVATFFHDTNGSATRTGFDTAFHSPEGITVAQQYTFKVHPFGLPGHQRIGAGWSSKEFMILKEQQKLQMPTGLLVLSKIIEMDKRPDDWGLWYNFDQYVYTEPQDEKQGVGVFGRIGWTTGEANPVENFYSIGLGGKGPINGRDNDTWGTGYYYLNMSDDLEFVGINAEQGVEMYYNIEVTPWCHITPDFQVIVDPGAGKHDADLALVYGLRVKMNL